MKAKWWLCVGLVSVLMAGLSAQIGWEAVSLSFATVSVALIFVASIKASEE